MNGVKEAVVADTTELSERKTLAISHAILPTGAAML
jgi:hypothetical protein